MEKKNGLSEVMDTMISKLHEMADQNAVVGQPIVTADGVTLIPVSRVSIGFGTGGSEYGAAGHFAGGGGAGAKMEPVSFLIVKDGSVRILPVAIPAMNTVDRVLEMVPTVVEKVENIVAKKTDEPLA
ncbi:MAG: GerW family sporulation protein [Oscillospiraceae bacterium]